MDALVNLIQKDDFPLAELVISENKLKNDIHDFINALGSNQSLQKLGGQLFHSFTSFHFQVRNTITIVHLYYNSE